MKWKIGNKLLVVGILMLSCFPISLHAQFQTYQYTTRSGLPHNLCYQMMEDRNGSIFIGTDYGISKYANNHFKNYGILPGMQSNFVIDVVETPSYGKVLATSGSGIYFMDQPELNRQLSKSNNYQKFSFIYENKGIIYAHSGVSQFVLYKKGKVLFDSFLFVKEKRNKNSSSHKVFRQNNFFKKANNKIFLMANSRHPSLTGFYEIDSTLNCKKKFTFLPEIPFTDISYIHEKYTGICEKGWYRFTDKKLIQFVPFPYTDFTCLNLFENSHYCVVLAQNKTSALKRIFLFSKETKKWSVINPKRFDSCNISDILLPSKSKVIFVSTYGQGVFKLVPNKKEFLNPQILGKNLMDFASDQNHFYFSTSNQILITNHELKLLKTIQSPTIDFIKGISHDTIFVSGLDPNKKEIKALGKTFIFQLSRRQKKLPSLSLSMTPIVISKSDKDKDNYMEIDHYFPAPEQLRFKEVIEENGNLWVASNEGIAVFDLKKQKFRTRFLKGKQLNSDQIRWISSYKGKVWAATLNELVVFDSKFHCKTFPYSTVFKDQINHFAIDKTGRIWIATQNGFALFENGSFRRFSLEDGYPFTTTNRVWIAKGKVFLLATSGLLALNENTLLHTQSPTIHLKFSGGRMEGSTLELVAGEEGAIHVQTADMNSFPYRAEWKNKQGKWIELPNDKLKLQRLPLGAHDLQFRARYLNSNYNYSKVIHFTKLTPFYLRWYFILLYLLSLLTIIHLVVSWQVKKLKKRNLQLTQMLEENQKLQQNMDSMRENIAQDFHDELGNKIVGITLTAQRLAARSQQQNDREMANRIQKDSRDLSVGIRDFIWAIDAKNETLMELIVALSDFGEQLFDQSGIQFSINYEANNTEIRLPAYWNRHLLLICKEAMTNALKYSEATNVFINLILKENVLEISIQDNGVGFSVENLSRKNGLLNMKLRAKKLDGVLYITNQAGTAIQFRGELAKK